MIRRLVRKFGWVTVAQLGWRHRGTVARAVDAVRRAPTMVAASRGRDSMTEARAVARLARERDLARRTDIRLGSVGDGSVVLHGPSGDPAVEKARRVLLDVREVVDVRAADEHERVAPRGDAGAASAESPVSSRSFAPTNAPGSPGVVGEQPNRAAGDVAPLDEAPLGQTPMQDNADAHRAP